MSGNYSSFQGIFYLNTQINSEFWGVVSQKNIQTFHYCLSLYQADINELVSKSSVNGLKDN